MMKNLIGRLNDGNLRYLSDGDHQLRMDTAKNGQHPSKSFLRRISNESCVTAAGEAPERTALEKARHMGAGI